MVHHRILQFCLQGLFTKEAESALFGLLDCISKLCTETVDVFDWEQTVTLMKEAVINFEKQFPQLMVCVFANNLC